MYNNSSSSTVCSASSVGNHNSTIIESHSRDRHTCLTATSTIQKTARTPKGPRRRKVACKQKNASANEEMAQRAKNAKKEKLPTATRTGSEAQCKQYNSIISSIDSKSTLLVQQQYLMYYLVPSLPRAPSRGQSGNIRSGCISQRLRPLPSILWRRTSATGGGWTTQYSCNSCRILIPPSTLGCPYTYHISSYNSCIHTITPTMIVLLLHFCCCTAIGYRCCMLYNTTYNSTTVPCSFAVQPYHSTTTVQQYFAALQFSRIIAEWYYYSSLSSFSIDTCTVEVVPLLRVEEVFSENHKTYSLAVQRELSASASKTTTAIVYTLRWTRCRRHRRTFLVYALFLLCCCEEWPVSQEGIRFFLPYCTAVLYRCRYSQQQWRLTLRYRFSSRQLIREIHDSFASKAST